MYVVNIGYGNVISESKIIAVISPDSAPIKRLLAEQKEQKKLIDVTHGRKTRAVIITTDNLIFLSALNTETIAQRIEEKRLKLDGGEKSNENTE